MMHVNNPTHQVAYIHGVLSTRTWASSPRPRTSVSRQGQWHAILTSRRLEAKDMSSRTATLACPVFCTRSWTGWMSLSECSAHLFTGSAKCHSTWWNAACRSLTLPIGSISAVCRLPSAAHTRVNGVRCSVWRV